VAEGKPEAYNADNVRFFGKDSASSAAGIAQHLAHTGCSLYVDVGAPSGSSYSPMGIAKEYGALLIAGTARWVHQGAYACYGDYVLFMGDVIAAGALASGDEVVKSSVVAGDAINLFAFALLCIAVILAVAGMPVVNWLNM